MIAGYFFGAPVPVCYLPVQVDEINAFVQFVENLFEKTVAEFHTYRPVN
jgi:hypothetical protein